MAIAYAIHYKQKKQELQQALSMDPASAAKFLTQFSLDPTFVARALKEKSESQRSGPSQSIQPGPALVAGIPSGAPQPAHFHSGFFPPKIGGYTGMILPGGEVPPDLHALHMQLQLAQQYQAMHSNPGLVQQLSLQAMLPPYVMGRPAPGTAAAMVASPSLPLTNQPRPGPGTTPSSIVSTAVSHDLVDLSQKIPAVKSDPAPEPTNRTELTPPLTECVAHDTKELAVRSFGALLNGIAASEETPNTATPAISVSDQT
jgi:hypothetical protein